MTVFERIKKHQNEFTKSQNLISDHILLNHKALAFMNSVDMAKAIGVSNPTIIRFATMLGYSGFPELQNELQKILSNELNSLDRVSWLALDNKDDYISSILQNEINNISNANKMLDRAAISEAVDLLAESEIIYVLGEQASETIAYYTAYTLSKICNNVKQLKGVGLSTFRRNKSKASKVAVVFCYSRYPRKTLEMIKLLHKMDTPIILVTDSLSFPLLSLAKIPIVSPVKYITFVDPFAVPICIANCLIVGVLNKNKDTSLINMNIFEDYVSFCDIFGKGMAPEK